MGTSVSTAPPIRTAMFDKSGDMTRAWAVFFQWLYESVGTIDSLVFSELYGSVGGASKVPSGEDMTSQKAIRMVDGSQLTPAPIAYYTVPPRTTTRILRITLTNTSVGTQTANIYLVPVGGFADASNVVLKDKAITSGVSYVAVEAENHVMEAGGTLQAAASFDATITMVASGVEIVG